MSSSERVNRILAAIRCQEIQNAIQRAKITCCAPPPVVQTTEVPPESNLENAKADTNQWGTVFPGAIVIRGKLPVRESARMQKLNLNTIECSFDPTDPETRFSAYRRPFIPPVCTPISPLALNGNRPKPPNRDPCTPQRFQGTIIRTCTN